MGSTLIESVWWLPGHSDDEHVGSLRLDTDPPTLHLLVGPSNATGESVNGQTTFHDVRV